MKNKKENKLSACHCGSDQPYESCCKPYIEQLTNTPTSEALMRSRYTAFALLNKAYLGYSWHPDTCPKTIHLNKETKWLGLKIKNTEAGGISDDTGVVEFIARSKINGKANRLHETSRFTRFNNRWVYVDGKISS